MPRPIRINQTIDVAAGLIFREGKVLISRRYPHAHLGGLWEFPGGKRESGESFEECLKRELGEELGVDVVVGKRLDSVTHDYPGKRVHLKFFICRLRGGDPAPLGCPEIKWVGPDELRDYDFPGADAKVIGHILESPELWDD